MGLNIRAFIEAFAKTFEVKEPIIEIGSFQIPGQEKIAELGPCSVMDFPIHDYPHDYWRFTPEAFRVLLKKFPANIIGYSGNPKKPHTVIGIGFKLKDEINHKNFEEFKKILEHNKEFNTSTSKNLRKKMNNVLIKILELLNPNKNIECVKFVFE